MVHGSCQKLLKASQNVFSLPRERTHFFVVVGEGGVGANTNNLGGLCVAAVSEKTRRVTRLLNSLLDYLVASQVVRRANLRQHLMFI